MKAHEAEGRKTIQVSVFPIGWRTREKKDRAEISYHFFFVSFSNPVMQPLEYIIYGERDSNIQGQDNNYLF